MLVKGVLTQRQWWEDDSIIKTCSDEASPTNTNTANATNHQQNKKSDIPLNYYQNKWNEYPMVYRPSAVAPFTNMV